MIRNLKVLGLALVAVLAMSAMVASAASAQFTTTKGATLTATDKAGVKFTVTGQSVTCEEVVYTGTAPEASFTEVKVTSTYTGCKTGQGLGAKIEGFGQYGEANSCWFNLQSDGKADLACSGSADVTVNASPCVVHIPAQENIGTITYTTGVVSGKHDLTLDINVTGIKGTHTDGFLCPFGSSGENSEGVLEGEVTAHATSGGVRVDLTKH